MDLGKMAQDQLGNVLGSEKPKKKAKTSKAGSDGIVDDIVTNIDSAVQDKIPDGAVADIAESALDQNKDGRIVDDILRIGENLFKKK